MDEGLLASLGPCLDYYWRDGRVVSLRGYAPTSGVAVSEECQIVETARQAMLLPFAVNRIWTLAKESTTIVVLDLLNRNATAVVLMKDENFDLIPADTFAIDPCSETLDIVERAGMAIHLSLTDGNLSLCLINDFFNSPTLAARVELGDEPANCWSIVPG